MVIIIVIVFGVFVGIDDVIEVLIGVVGLFEVLVLLDNVEYLFDEVVCISCHLFVFVFGL